MKSRMYAAILLALLLICLSSAALANGQGSIRPWLLNYSDKKWGPVPEDRLETKVLWTNGNIISKYHQKNGVLYHSCIGNFQQPISDKTLNRVVIKPPQGAAYRVSFYSEGNYLNESETQFKYIDRYKTPVDNIHDALANPKPDNFKSILNGQRPEFEWELELFNLANEMCTPKRLASQNNGNIYLAAWYDIDENLIRVDWLVETSDDFSIKHAPLSGKIHKGFESEERLPYGITNPSLIIPWSDYGMKFRLGVYFYPSYRGNSDFAELYLMQENEDEIVPDYVYGKDPIVIYWPYPQGYSYTSPVHYQLKHYLDNTHTKFEILNVTPMPKGLRIETKSLSPFEMTWTEIEPMPDTGDHASLAVWCALMLVCACCAAMIFRRVRA